MTQFLLDLTEDAKLSEAFQADPDGLIESRGLGQYRELLLSGDVRKLRAAVRAEVTGQAPGEAVRGVMKPPDGEPEAIIAGVRGVREPPPPDGPIEGVREPPPDEPIPGVMEPGPPDEIRGVMEPGPPDEIRGVMEPGPPESL